MRRWSDRRALSILLAIASRLENFGPNSVFNTDRFSRVLGDFPICDFSNIMIGFPVLQLPISCHYKHNLR